MSLGSFYNKTRKRQLQKEKSMSQILDKNDQKKKKKWVRKPSNVQKSIASRTVNTFIAIPIIIPMSPSQR